MAGREELIERLLADPEFRAEFRRDPAGAARRMGVDGAEFASGDPLQTLDVRESRSSLAGVMAAAAVEGVALFAFADHADAAVIPADRDLLHNENLTFDADGIADLEAGRIDARIVSVLETLSREHTITVSAMCSDHAKFTAGGSISNHVYGRAVDIATVDGQPVSPGNAAAKEVAAALSRLDPAIRPTEIGSPWALDGSAYFTDADHQDHLHIAFDDPIDPDWKPQAGTAAPAAADAPDDEAGAARASASESGDDSSHQDDGDGDDSDDDDSDDDDGDLREDGGSGDTEAEADDESDDDDEEDEEDDDADDGTEDEGDDEDEDEPDENEEDEPDDGIDGGSSDDGSDGGDSADGSDSRDSDGDAPDGDAQQEAPAPDPDVAVDEYPGDDAGKQEIAAWMAEAARKRGIPAELPVMAALVESGVSNLNYGDADSVGFFQMRLGIWNQGDYAGYPDEPDLQLAWFLDHAEAVMKQRAAQGLPVDDPKQYGEWIADIERPAAEYRGRYQLQLDQARELLAQLGASEPAADLSADVVKLKVITPEEARRWKEGG